MDNIPKSFTLEANGILRELKTECGVCPAYDLLSTKQHPQIQKFIGLWDTGATGTVIDLKAAKKLGLQPIKKAKVYHAHGDSIVNVYAINLFLPNQVAFTFVQVTEGRLKDIDILIGMDIISRGDFSITNFEGKTTFSFRIPSTQKIDFNENLQQRPHS